MLTSFMLQLGKVYYLDELQNVALLLCIF